MCLTTTNKKTKRLFVYYGLKKYRSKYYSLNSKMETESKIKQKLIHYGAT